MADLSAISPDSIKALEEALSSIGISVGEADGVADEDLKVGVFVGLNTLNRIFGDGGTVLDYDAAQIAELKQGVESFVKADGAELSQFDQLKALAKRDFATLGLEGVGNTISRNIINGYFQDKTPAEALPDLLKFISTQKGYENIATLLEKIPPNVMADLPAALEFVGKAEEHLAVVDAMAEGGFFVEDDQTVVASVPEQTTAPPVQTPGPSDASDQSGLDTTTTIVATAPEDETAESTLAEKILANDPVEKQKKAIQEVEVLLGIENPDGDWGVGEQAALKALIADMQLNDSVWLGRKNGIYTNDYAQYVLSDRGSFTPEQKSLFTSLAALDEQHVELVAKDDKPPEPLEVQTAIATVQKALKDLIPVVQGELDERRADAQKLIDSIEKGALSKTETDATIKAIADANAVLESDASDEAKAEALRIKESAQEYLDSHSGLADNIGAFIDGFIFMGEENFGRDDFGKKMVETGKAWAVDMIKGRLDNFHDLPSVDSLNLDDGVLDIRDQTALQGVTFLLAHKLGIPGNDSWRYTPELGQQILSRLDKLTFEEKETLVLAQLTDEQIADYQSKSDEDKKAFLDKQAEVGTTKLLEAMDILHEAGVLVPQRLYYHEEVQIPDLTKEIFAEFLEGKRDPLNDHYHEAQATPVERNVMNLMVYEFTQGFELASIMGEDYELSSDITNIDHTKTASERFAEMYQQDVDLNEMYGMLSTLPFGTEERRVQFEVLFKALETLENGASEEEYERLFKELEAAKFSQDLIKKVREAQEGGNITVEILASIYGDGVSEINANPAAGSRYLFSSQRQVTIDPRLDDFELQIDGQQVNADDIFKLHKDQNNNFKPGKPYEPTYFRAEDGTLYVAAVDVESKIFQIEVLDLEGWQRVIGENQRQPGEDQYDHSVRLDEALSDVSGYDLLFQNMHEGGQATFAPGSIDTFPTSSFVANIPSYASVKSSVDAEVSVRQRAALKEQVDAAMPDALPENFGRAAAAPESGSGPTSFDEYNKNPIDQNVQLDVSTPDVSAPGVSFQTGQ